MRGPARIIRQTGACAPAQWACQRLGVAAVAACIAAVLVAVPAVAQGRDNAAPSETEVLRHARQLISAGRTDEAAKLLEDAARRWPASPDVHTNLGYVYELLGRVEDAVEQYATTAAMAPGNVYAAERLRRLFYGVHFPTRLRISQLGVLPVRLARFQVRRPDGAFVDVAVTVSGLFPETMRATSKPVARTVPPGAVDGERCEFNRVIYVFVGQPKADRLYLRARVFYPSRFLSREGHDYSTLAAALARMLARFEVYLQVLVAPQAAPALSVWLCEGGPAGAEQKDRDIFIYRITSLRPGEEWVRELAHELGHARLPDMAGWSEPETSLAGDLAERWLLSALCYEAEYASGELWPATSVRQWVSGLWPPGSLNPRTYLADRVRGPVRRWIKLGPYLPGTASEADARRLALGLLLWVNAAHGPAAMRRMLGDQATLPSLAAAYMNWANGAGSRLGLSARACLAADDRAQAWLPFGEPAVQVSAERLLTARLFLPAGAWRAADETGQPLLVRWLPLGTAAQGQSVQASAVVQSAGAWGTLQIASDQPRPVRRVVLTKGGEA